MVDLVTDSVKSLLFIYLFFAPAGPFLVSRFFLYFEAMVKCECKVRPGAACGAVSPRCAIFSVLYQGAHKPPAPRSPSTLIPLTAAVPGVLQRPPRPEALPPQPQPLLPRPSQPRASASPRHRPAAGRAGPCGEAAQTRWRRWRGCGPCGGSAASRSSCRSSTSSLAAVSLVLAPPCSQRPGAGRRRAGATGGGTARCGRLRPCPPVGAVLPAALSPGPSRGGCGDLPPGTGGSWGRAAVASAARGEV